MAVEFILPLEGIVKGMPPGKEIKASSEYMNNVRPFDVLEKKIRIGQRPALDKWGAGTLIGAAEQPVVAMCSVSSVI